MGISSHVWLPRWGFASNRNMWLAAAVRQLNLPGKGQAHQLAAWNLQAMYQELYLRTTAVALVICNAHPRWGPNSTSCLAGLIPHLLPIPDHQAHPAQCPTFSGTDPVSRLLPAPEQSSLACCPASWESFNLGKASAGHRPDQELLRGLVGHTHSLAPAQSPSM